MPKMFNISDVKYVDPQTLKTWLVQGTTNLGSKFQIIDVRDSDYVGGHIVESMHIKSTNFKDEQLPLLLSTLRERKQDTLIFHCMLSQQRGPSAAMRFIRYLNHQLGISDDEAEIDFIKNVNVYILRGGFGKWQELYGEDHRLTEEYDRSIWKFGL